MAACTITAAVLFSWTCSMSVTAVYEIRQPHSRRGIPGTAGPKGDPGDVGAPGPIGVPGYHGTPGEPGMPGEKGFPGSRGFPGPRGLKGDSGSVGPVGVKGDRGDPGNPGIKGEVGFPGRDGLQGLNGMTGLPGPRGPQGESGDAGFPGPSGVPGEQGSPGPNGTDVIRNPVIFTSTVSGVEALSDSMIHFGGNVFTHGGGLLDEMGANDYYAQFRPPFCGIYVFYVSAIASSNLAQPLQLFHNDRVVGQTVHTYHHGSAQVTLMLLSGQSDVIQLKTQSGTGTYDVTMTGMLYHQMECTAAVEADYNSPGQNV